MKDLWGTWRTLIFVMSMMLIQAAELRGNYCVSFKQASENKSVKLGFETGEDCIVK